MKRINSWIIITTLFLAPILPSCLDVLDVAPDGNLTIDEVLADPNKAAALVSACYDELPAFGWMFDGWDNMFTSLSDDAWSARDGGPGTYVGMLYKGQASASFHPLVDAGTATTYIQESNNTGKFWDRYWMQIRRCQQVIDVIDRSAASESNKRLYKAEAQVLKSWFYLELIKLYGKLPVFKEVAKYDADFSTLKRESVYDIVTKCIAADCDAAIATAELPWRIDNPTNAQRVTKALAHSIKATAYLFAASPLHNEGNNYWEEAYQVCRAAVNALKTNGYELFKVCTEPSIFGIGDEAAFYQLVAREMDYPQNRDKETIWQKDSRRYDGVLWYRAAFLFCYVYVETDGSICSSACPSMELIDAFETRDGKPILDLRQPYLDDRHLRPNFLPGTGYNDQDPYSNRDPRFYATVLYNGAVIPWKNGLPLTVETYEGGAHAITFDNAAGLGTRTGHYHRKMVAPGASPTNDFPYPSHKYFRLAEILLSCAEAAAEAGHYDEAREYVNEVRARVKMDPLPSTLIGEDLILRIRNERRVELAYENQRYFDIRRWQKPTGNIEAQYKWSTGMLLLKQGNGSFTYVRVNTNNVGRYGYDTKDLLLPIPMNEASLLESITGDKWQNPGW